MNKKLIISFLLIIMTGLASAFSFRFNLLNFNMGIKNFGTYRSYNDGTFAKSCLLYKGNNSPYQYIGDTGDGIYRIKPDSSTPFDVYCDMTNGGYTEIFDLNRNNSLTLTQLLNQLQNFNSSLTLNASNFGLDSNGLYWAKNGGAIGASIGIEKINFSSVKLTYSHIADAAKQGLVVTSTNNIEGCSSNINDSNSCFNLASKFGINTNDYNFQIRDFTTGNTNWNEITMGVLQTMSGNVSLDVNFSHTFPMFLTMVGRTENSVLTNGQNYIKAIKVK